MVFFMVLSVCCLQMWLACGTENVNHTMNKFSVVNGNPIFTIFTNFFFFIRDPLLVEWILDSFSRSKKPYLAFSWTDSNGIDWLSLKDYHHEFSKQRNDTLTRRNCQSMNWRISRMGKKKCQAPHWLGRTIYGVSRETNAIKKKPNSFGDGESSFNPLRMWHATDIKPFENQ